MLNLGIMVIIIVVGVYFRTKYDREYALPIIAENEDLSVIKKYSLILIGLAGIFYFINMKISFIILFCLIPFALYLNLKTTWLAFKRRKNNK